MGGGDGEQCPSALGTTKATSVGLGIGMQIISQQANICAPIHASFLLTVPVSMHMVSAFSATVPSGVTVLNYFPFMRDNLSLVCATDNVSVFKFSERDLMSSLGSVTRTVSLSVVTVIPSIMYSLGPHSSS